jgi:putative hemolysin
LENNFLDINLFCSLFNQISWFDVFNPIDYMVGIELLIILLLVTGSAIVSSAEVALFSISINQIKELEESEEPIDKKILEQIDKPRRLLATILMANNIFNISIVLVFYGVTKQMFNPVFFENHKVLEFLIQVVLVTFFLLLFGEVLPKVYASHNNLGVARFVMAPIRFFTFIFTPFVNVLIKSTTYLENNLNKKVKGVSARDIDQAIDLAVEDEYSRNTKILKGIVKFGNLSVTQIMQSRMDVIAVDKASDFKELLSLVRESGYSRMPVYEDDLDHVVGVIFAKDLLKYLNEPQTFDWSKLMRTPFFVPENKMIDDLLAEFQSKRNHLAVVVDEYGGTSGIVTLEDILEEVIGEINDEFDDEINVNFQKLDDQNYIFEAKTPLNDVCKVLNFPVDYFESYGDADSLGGLVLELKGEIPIEGEVVVHQKDIFTVLEVNNTRIIRVKITLAN